MRERSETVTVTVTEAEAGSGAGACAGPATFRDPSLDTRWRAAFDQAREKGLFERLSEVYAKVPGGRCSGCTACCAESDRKSVV